MTVNAALLAARLSGRPLLMLPTAAESYARQLLTLGVAERPRGILGWLSPARRARSQAAEAEGSHGPACYYPMWLEASTGAPDGEGFGWSLKNGIALVDIDGPLVERGFAWDGETYVAGYDCLAQTFAEIGADARVRGVFIHHDSPGGVAGPGLPALSAQLRALRAEKPVWSYCEMAASADYWIASSTSRVVAPGLGYVGSIGAVLTHCDMSGALEKDGVVVTQIQFGAKKTDGSPYKPLSDGAKADLQAEIDEVGALFVANVVAGRPALTREAILGTEAACFLAQASDPARSGLELGLVDAILSEQAAFAELSELIARPSGSLTTVTLPKEAELDLSTLSDAELTAELQRRQAAKGDPDPDNDDTTGDGDGDEGMGGDEGEDGDDGDGDEDRPDAAAIAASPAAKTHAALALTAIEKGMTLAQFEAMATIAPAGRAGGKGALREFMTANQPPRLGPDAASAAGAPTHKALFELALAGAKKLAEKAGSPA